MNDQEFRIVVNKRRQKWKNRKTLWNKEYLENDEQKRTERTTFTKEQLFKRINDCIEDVKRSRYFEDASKVIESNVNLKPSAIVCYGLGRLTVSRCARYQFAFLLLLRNVVDCQRVLLYDPVFTEFEKECLINDFECEIIDENEKCKRRIGCERVLFFMPHCDKALFNNLLWINWDVLCLSNSIIFGNSFHSMIDSIVTKEAKEEFSYLLNALDLNLVNEYQIENNFEHKDVFNDLSLHLFAVSAMDENILNACYSSRSPVYSDQCDVI